jgi:hypothetical protein
MGIQTPVRKAHFLLTESTVIFLKPVGIICMQKGGNIFEIVPKMQAMRKDAKRNEANEAKQS